MNVIEQGLANGCILTGPHRTNEGRPEGFPTKDGLWDCEQNFRTGKWELRPQNKQANAMHFQAMQSMWTRLGLPAQLCNAVYSAIGQRFKTENVEVFAKIGKMGKPGMDLVSLYMSAPQIDDYHVWSNWLDRNRNNIPDFVRELKVVQQIELKQLIKVCVHALNDGPRTSSSGSYSKSRAWK